MDNKIPHFTNQELIDMGFVSVGSNTQISRDVKFYSCSGSIGSEVRIDAFAILTGNIQVEDGVHISPFCFLSGAGGLIRMCSGSGIGSHSAIFTKSDPYSISDLVSNIKVLGSVIIGPQVIIGSGCKILPAVNIGARAVIGCNSVIAENIPAASIVVSRAASLVRLGSRDNK